MDGGERMMEPALAGAPASALPVLAVLREWGWAVEEVEPSGPRPEDADAPPESAPPPREGVLGSEDGEGDVEDDEEGKATEKEETEDEEDGGTKGRRRRRRRARAGRSTWSLTRCLWSRPWTSSGAGG